MKTITNSAILKENWQTNVIIRPLKFSDLRGLEWDGAYIQYRKVYQRTYQRTLEGTSLMWIAELPAFAMIGQVFIQLDSLKKEIAIKSQRAYLHGFRIKPSFRNLGLGKKMLNFVEQDLIQRGYSEIILNVAKTNLPAIHLYEKTGYTIIGHEDGDWTFRDHQNRLRRIIEPAWKMLKVIKN